MGRNEIGGRLGYIEFGRTRPSDDIAPLQVIGFGTVMVAHPEFQGNRPQGAVLRRPVFAAAPNLDQDPAAHALGKGEVVEVRGTDDILAAER